MIGRWLEENKVAVMAVGVFFVGVGVRDLVLALQLDHVGAFFVAHVLALVETHARRYRVVLAAACASSVVQSRKYVFVGEGRLDCHRLQLLSRCDLMAFAAGRLALFCNCDESRCLVVLGSGAVVLA